MLRGDYDHSLCWLHLLEWAESFRSKGEKERDQAYAIVWQVAEWADDADELMEIYDR